MVAFVTRDLSPPLPPGPLSRLSLSISFLSHTAVPRSTKETPVSIVENGTEGRSGQWRPSSTPSRRISAPLYRYTRHASADPHTAHAAARTAYYDMVWYNECVFGGRCALALANIHTHTLTLPLPLSLFLPFSLSPFRSHPFYLIYLGEYTVRSCRLIGDARGQVASRQVFGILAAGAAASAAAAAASASASGGGGGGGAEAALALPEQEVQRIGDIGFA